MTRYKRYVLLPDRLFDGKGIFLDKPAVVVEGKYIVDVTSRGSLEVGEHYSIIELKGVTLLPGLIDAHVHFSGLKTYNPAEAVVTPLELRVLRAAQDSQKALYSGFTTVRDCGGTIALSLKRATAEGTIVGSRIVASGRPICQTGGHCDIHYLPLEDVAKRGNALLCDGPWECRKAARIALRDGADFIKIMTSGGVGSEKDDPKHPQMSIEEVKSVVEEAHRVGKKVASHAQGSEGVKIAILGGVDSIEHGYFLDDESIELLLKKGIYYVPTLCLVEVYKKMMENPPPGVPEWRLRKQEECIEHMPKSFIAAYRAGVKIATGTDYYGPPMRAFGHHANEPITMVKYGMNPVDALIAATSNAAECLGLSYAGSIEKGKIADLVGVIGDPVADINSLKNVVFVMKEGVTISRKVD
ncbi:MAG: amidohydrolase family protein [Sulfolobales archaeon]|nr:amidohydrolase family protein [Sulfolobales archaeon]MDW8083104.1 amidohydrolase family protein [Sulfolobales archaeon]